MRKFRWIIALVLVGLLVGTCWWLASASAPQDLHVIEITPTS